MYGNYNSGNGLSGTGVLFTRNPATGEPCFWDLRQVEGLQCASPLAFFYDGRLRDAAGVCVQRQVTLNLNNVLYSEFHQGGSSVPAICKLSQFLHPRARTQLSPQVRTT